MDGVAFAGREKSCSGFLHQFCIAIVGENDHLMPALGERVRNANERIDIAQTAKTGDDEFYGGLLGGVMGSIGSPMFRETTLTGYNISGNAKREGGGEDSHKFVFTNHKPLHVSGLLFSFQICNCCFCLFLYVSTGLLQKYLDRHFQLFYHKNIH